MFLHVVKYSVQKSQQFSLFLPRPSIQTQSKKTAVNKVKEKDMDRFSRFPGILSFLSGRVSEKRKCAAKTKPSFTPRDVLSVEINSCNSQTRVEWREKPGRGERKIDGEMRMRRTTGLQSSGS